MASTATEVILTDEDFVVVDMEEECSPYKWGYKGQGGCKPIVPESWAPKVLRDNLKRLDAHNKGIKAPLQPSSSFRFTPAPALAKALEEMSTFTGSDELYWEFLYKAVGIESRKSIAQFRKALQFAGLGRP